MGREARCNSDISVINRRLGDLFGKDVVTNEPIHRVIACKGITEKRRGNFAVHTEGGIFLRDEWNLVKECLKYPYAQDCYALEMLVPFEKLDSEQVDEIIPGETTKYSYEAFYIFQDKDNKPLPVNWRAVELIMHFKLYGKREKNTGRTEDIDKQHEDEKHIKYFEGEMAASSLITDPKFGVKGVFVPSSYDLKRYGNGRLQDLSVVKEEQVTNNVLPVNQMQGV